MLELAVPKVSQPNGYTCGPASLLACLRFLGVAGNASVASLARELGTKDYFCSSCKTDGGTYTHEMVAAIERRWPTVEVRRDLDIAALRTIVGLGDVAILMVQAWANTEAEDFQRYGYADRFSDGHFVVATAVRRHDVVMMCPSSPTRVTVTHDDLMNRWHELDGNYLVRGGAIVLKGPAETRRRRIGKTAPMG